MKTHQMTNTKIYKIWNSMRWRCNPKNKRHTKWYFDKGILVCKEWDNFLNFYNWSIQNGYQDGLSIDRINSDGNYEPNNCQWITIKENIIKGNKERKRKNGHKE